MRGHRAHYALTLIAIVAVLSAPADADAQTASNFVEPDPNVIVDLSALDAFGGAPNVADMLRGGYRGPGAAGPDGAATGGAPAPAWLRRPDAPRYAAPPPEVQALIRQHSVQRPTVTASRSASVPAAPPPATPRKAETPTRAAVPPPTRPATAEAADTKPAAAPAAPPPPPAIPPASAVPTPPPPAADDQAASSEETAPPPATEAAPPTPIAPATQVANVPAQPPTSPPTPAPAEQSAAGDLVRIGFASGQSQLPADATAELDAVVARLKGDGTIRIQLLAYAGGDQDGANKARRVSLSRALAVRAYLIDREVASTRMDVRALGNRADGGPPDRVDVVVVER